MNVLIFLILLGLVIVLLPYILGAFFIVASLIGLAITFVVVTIDEVWKSRRR